MYHMHMHICVCVLIHAPTCALFLCTHYTHELILLRHKPKHCVVVKPQVCVHTVPKGNYLVKYLTYSMGHCFIQYIELT